MNKIWNWPIATRDNIPKQCLEISGEMANSIPMMGVNSIYGKNGEFNSQMLISTAPSSQKNPSSWHSRIFFCVTLSPTKNPRSKTKTMVKTCLISSFLTDAKTTASAFELSKGVTTCYNDVELKSDGMFNLERIQLSNVQNPVDIPFLIG